MQANLPFPKKERIQYIDALRGFTMILVVFHHVECFGFFNFSYESVIGQLFQSFRMPLFFFISGFIAYKKNRVWNASTIGSLLKKKMLVQIIPALFLGLIYTYIFLHRDFKEFVTDPAKLGYWFTFVLLEMFVIYYFVSGISHLLSKKTRLSEPILTTWLLILTALCLYLLKSLFNVVPLLDSIGNYTSLHNTLKYFMYFVFGVLSRQYQQEFENIIDNKYVSAIVLFLFSTTFYLSLQKPHLIFLPGIMAKVYETSVKLIPGFLGIVIVYAFFRKYAHSFTNSTKLGNMLQYIGRRTLDIYVLHYFFLPHLPEVGDFLISSNNMILELFVGIGLSLLIIGVCLCISNIIRISSVLSKILLGS